MFLNAINGIIIAFKTERNIRILTIIGFLVGFTIPRMTAIETAIVVIVIFQVISGEIMNTAIERTCDTITQEQNEDIRIIKDISAGSVLLSVGMSLLVAILLILPKLLSN